MIIAYIKMYLRLGLGSLTILQLNQLQKEIDLLIQTRCDLLMAKDNITEQYLEADQQMSMGIVRTYDDPPIFT